MCICGFHSQKVKDRLFVESAGKGDIVQVAVPDLTDKILLITVWE
jgi:hypothetical protein